MKTIIFNAQILPKAERQSFIKTGYLEIENDRIVSIHRGDYPFVASTADSHNLFDARNKLVIPGLFNAHTHLAMTLFKGLGEDLPLMRWLREYIFPLEAKWVKPEIVRLGAQLAVIESVRSGVTSFADMYYFGEETASAVQEAGLRVWAGQAVTSVPMPDSQSLSQSFKRVEKLQKQFQSHPLVEVVVAPHSTYTESLTSLEEIATFCRANGLMAHSHISETQSEQVEVAEKYAGLTPAKVLDKAGFSEVPIMLAHGVYLSESDLRTLESFNRVTIVYNPESNMKLGSGIANVPMILASSVHLALGTDGSASNNDLDMFGEMGSGAKLQKVRCLDAKAVTAEQIFEAATLGGATAVGRESDMGTLEVGKQADLAFVDTTKPHWVPLHDPLSSLLYCAKSGDVTDLMVRGQWVMRNSNIETLDEFEILSRANDIGAQIRLSLEKGTSRP
jgi:5-methylthioadenosine/S-adenosylhomocysteine deaminase